MAERKTSKRAQHADTVARAYRRLFSTEDGKLVLEDLMKCNFIATPSVGTDVHMTYFNEGARSVVLRIIRTCNLEEKQLERMIAEMNKVDEEMFN